MNSGVQLALFPFSLYSGQDTQDIDICLQSGYSQLSFSEKLSQRHIQKYYNLKKN